MGWFSRKRFAEVSPQGGTELRIHRLKGGDQLVDLADATWIGFADIASALSMAENEGWWLIGHADGAVAIRDFCDPVDTLLRTGALSEAAERVPVKIVIGLSSTPTAFLRGLMDGVAVLDTAASDRLRTRGSTRSVASVTDFPFSP